MKNCFTKLGVALSRLALQMIVGCFFSFFFSGIPIFRPFLKARNLGPVSSGCAGGRLVARAPNLRRRFSNLRALDPRQLAPR